MIHSFYKKSTSIYWNEPYSKEEVRSFMRVSNVTVRKRLTMVLLIGIFIFFIIDMRLGYVQMILGEGLQKEQKDYGAEIFHLNRSEEKLSTVMVLRLQQILVHLLFMLFRVKSKILQRQQKNLQLY